MELHPHVLNFHIGLLSYLNIEFSYTSYDLLITLLYTCLDFIARVFVIITIEMLV